MELSIGALALRMKTNDPATEQALVDRCRQHDVEAFAKLVDAYQNRVHGFVRRVIPHTEDAADITQEVFIRAYQSFSRFDGRSSLRTWLFRIAYNLCIDRVRKEKRSLDESSLDYAAEDDAAWEVPDARWDPQAMVLDDEMRQVIEGALMSMSDKLRAVLLLHDKEDFAYDEIAQTLNLPIGTVKSRLFLARAHLKKSVGAYLSENGVDL